MYLHDCLPLPWRVVRTLEGARLAWPFGRTATLPRLAGELPGTVTLAALGDVFVRQLPEGGVFDGLGGAIAAADIACCNLEAPITAIETPASPLGAALRAPDGTAQLLRDAGIAVVNVAANHALDSGHAGFRQSLGHLAQSGVDACGIAGEGNVSQLLVREVRGLRIGFLGYCDDHAPVAAVSAEPRPALAEPARMAEEVAAAAARVDALVVQLHWGYEFRFHPLRRHRDLARELLRRGARLVLCHHAHVPMGVERQGEGLIAYGLGNALFPLTPYMRAGHGWSSYSALLEVQLSPRGVAGARLVPFRLDPQGLPRALQGAAAARVLRALAVASARLDDESFMRRCERAQLVFEGASLLRAIAAASARDEATLAARLRTLGLPRQQALLDGIGALPGGAPLVATLRQLLLAAQSGEDAGRAHETGRAGLDAGLAALKKAFDWRAALAARVP